MISVKDGLNNPSFCMTCGMTMPNQHQCLNLPDAPEPPSWEKECPQADDLKLITYEPKHSL